mgnify:CR=1 FL=1
MMLTQFRHAHNCWLALVWHLFVLNATNYGIIDLSNIKQRKNIMGWTGNYISSNFSYADEKKLIQDLFTWPGESEYAASLLQLSKQGSAWYAAVQFLPADPDKFAGHPYYLADPIDGSITWAAVILTSRSGSEFMYKDLEESVGPNECKAPLSLLKKLSPLKENVTDNPGIWAGRWRDKCIDAANGKKQAKSLKDGYVIKLGRPMIFSGWGDLSIFKKETMFGSNLYRGYRTEGDVVNGRSVGLCRLPTRHLVDYDFSIISPDSIAASV